MPAPLTVLALETSCDETGIAVLRDEEKKITVVAQGLASQMDIHAATGGVVPEVAAREHVKVLRPLLEQVLREGKVGAKDIDAVAVTVGPGLQPALAVGVTAARTLAYAWQKPLIPIHHLEGHIYSALLVPSNGTPITNYQLPVTSYGNLFPALALLVSGGHTMLVLMRDHLRYEVIGSTKDDAAGEAFDKVARLLGLPYPGGPHLSKLAEQGNSQTFHFTHPLLHSSTLDFSFSGLKTQVLYTLREQGVRYPVDKVPDPFIATDPLAANIAASFERVVVETLVAKTKQAVVQYQPRVLLLAGGVAANALLREKLSSLAQEMTVPLQVAPRELCGDNAVMIGLAGIYAFHAQRFVAGERIDAHARLDLTVLGHQAAAVSDGLFPAP